MEVGGGQRGWVWRIGWGPQGPWRCLGPQRMAPRVVERREDAVKLVKDREALHTPHKPRAST